MAKTLLQLRTHARTFLDEVSAADWSDDQINTELNYAYMEMYTAVIETYEDYYKTTSTTDLVSGQQSYELPEDFLKIRRLEIKYLSDDDYVKANPYASDQISSAIDRTNMGSTAAPIYELTGNFIRIIPVPDSTVTGSMRMTYIAQALELSADSDTVNIPFPDRYAKYIVKGACAELLRKGQQEEGVANGYDNQFQVGMEKMKQELETRYADGTKMILDMRGEYNDFSNGSNVIER